MADSSDPARAFADALHALEDSGDLDAMTARFADDAEVHALPSRRDHEGKGGVRDFWQEYLDQFDRVHSDFSRVETVGGSRGILEWTATGQLKGGHDITYDGVSLLDLNDDGLVTRFRTYYDSAAFVQVKADTK